MSRRLLDAAEVERHLEALPGWSSDGTSLHASFVFASFPEAIAAVGAIAVDAEAMDHHPDIDIRWRTLHLSLSTHSAGGITAMDIELAGRINEHAPPQ